MFANRNATAMLPATDLGRAKAWYEEKLGIRPARDMAEMGAIYELAGVRAFLYPTQYAGTAQHTVLTFESADLAADMAALRQRGVEFLEYDLPGIKTENGLADWGEMKNAWARDSEGNILAFVQGMV